MKTKLIFLLLLLTGLFSCQPNADLEILLQDDNSFYLNPAWQIATIDYEFQDRLYRRSQTERKFLNYANFKYSLDDQNIDSALVAELQSSIKELYQTQTILASYYLPHAIPAWELVITGVDGQTIQLITKNMQQGPWNFVIDGQLYAQFNGELGQKIWALFGEEPPIYSPVTEANKLFFSTYPRPEEIGELFFDGLEPMAERFSYQLDRSQKKFVGMLESESQSESRILDLLEVSYLNYDGNEINCEIVEKSNLFRRELLWEFDCPATGLRVNDRYRFPLTIVYQTAEHESVQASGLLWGEWSMQQFKKLPVPEFLRLPINDHQEARRLISDQTLYSVWFKAEVDPTRPLAGRMVGQIYLAGTVQIGQSQIPYTIGTPYSIEDGQFRNWALTKQFLDDSLNQIANLPISQKLVQDEPNLILRLRYSDVVDFPEFELPYGYEMGPFNMTLSLASCGTESAITLPGEKPLIDFTFYKHPHFRELSFALIDGEPHVKYLNLYPSKNEKFELSSLLPQNIFDYDVHFESITVDAYSHVWDPDRTDRYVRRIRLELPENVSADELAIYREIASSFPVPIDTTSVKQWTAENVMFDLADDGNLVLRSCSN
ncbi:MAG: hypothetical protein AB8G95_07440 [Anaerolineae bacterium]